MIWHMQYHAQNILISYLRGFMRGFVKGRRVINVLSFYQLAFCALIACVYSRSHLFLALILMHNFYIIYLV